MIGALDRTGNQVREQADEERVVDQGIGRLQAALVDVDDVRNFLKCVKRDPGWKEDSQRRGRSVVEPESFERCRERVHEEVEVLKRTKEPEVDDEGDRQQQFAPCPVVGARDRSRAVEIDDRRRGNQCKEAWIPPPVEHVAGEKEQVILWSPPETPIGEDDQGQEDDANRCIEKQKQTRW